MINAKLNDRVFDAMLEVACNQIMDERVAEWEDATVEYEFSPEFEKKMKRLLRSHTRRLRMRTARKAFGRVAAVLVVVMALGFTFTMSVQALRVQFFNTIMEYAEEYIGFSFGDGAVQTPSNVLRPGYLPEGYQETGVEELLSGIQIAYVNSNGNYLYFEQHHKGEALAISIDNEHTKPVYSIDVNGTSIQVHEKNADRYSSYFIWETDSMFYALFGSADPSEMLKMVKSILQ